MAGTIEISAHYDGELDNKKELQLFDQLKAYAAENYAAYTVGGSRFVVTHDDGVERHTHYLTLIVPVGFAQARPADATRGTSAT